VLVTAVFTAAGSPVPRRRGGSGHARSQGSGMGELTTSRTVSIDRCAEATGGEGGTGADVFRVHAFIGDVFRVVGTCSTALQEVSSARTLTEPAVDTGAVAQLAGTCDRDLTVDRRRGSARPSRPAWCPSAFRTACAWTWSTAPPPAVWSTPATGSGDAR